MNDTLSCMSITSPIVNDLYKINPQNKNIFNILIIYYNI